MMDIERQEEAFDRLNKLKKEEYIGNIMEVTSVKRIHQSDWISSGVPFYRARDIVAFSNNKDIEDKLFIDEKKYEEYSKLSGKVKENELLVTGVGTIGIPYLIKKNERFYFKDGNIIWLKNNSMNGMYLYQYLLSKKFINDIFSRTGIGTVATYTIEMAKETNVPIMINLYQNKIANFLTSLDSLIQKQEEYIEELKIQKKGYSQKYINTNKGCKIHFDNFLTKQINTIYVEDNKEYNQITITKNGNINARDRKLGSKIGRKRQFVIDLHEYPNTLTFIRQGIYEGGIGIIDNPFLNNSIVTENMPLLTIDTKHVNLSYLKHYLKSGKFKQNVLFNLKPAGSAQTAIHEKDLLKQFDIFPTLEEQQKIGNFLSVLDDKIELQEQKLEQLKLKKKYYLNKIFV